MTLDEIRNYCLAKSGVEETLPFGPTTLVFKVMGKMFLLTDVENPESINLKCEPEKAVELREKYEDITPGYHMSKVHWNTIRLRGRFTRQDLLSWIDDSYTLVFNSLPKKVRAGSLD